MPKPKQRHPDPHGERWHEEASARWAAASEGGGDPEDVLARYARGPALPSWSSAVPLKREVLGRYLEDRDTGVLHDVEHATDACDLDGISHGTWYHFLIDVERHAGDLTDHDCMRA